MLHTNLDSLLNALSQIDLDNAEDTTKLKALFKVYNDALRNPPKGIIGVGAITYAEDALHAYQLRNMGF